MLRAIKDGGISHADLLGIAARKMQLAVAKAKTGHVPPYL
jgi:hypothetical protein